MTPALLRRSPERTPPLLLTFSRRVVQHTAWPFLACALVGCTSDPSAVDHEASTQSNTSSDHDVSSDDIPELEAQWPLLSGSGLRVPRLPPLPKLEEQDDAGALSAIRELGRTLFYDSRLSGSRSTNCGSCHSPFADFQSNTPRDLPARSYPNISPSLPRHTPSLLNIVYATDLHWDGSESDLIESMVRPYAEPNMNLTDIGPQDMWALDIPTAKARLHHLLAEEIAGYSEKFSQAFGEDLADGSPERTWRLAGTALADFIRPATTGESLFDKWNRGDKDVHLSTAALRGLSIFVERGKCVECHDGPMQSDFLFHNLSLSETVNGKVVDLGRAHVTQKEADRGRFLTPSLRRVTKTSPYFHAGTMASLRDCIAHHTNGGARTDPQHDPLFDQISPLSRDDIDDLIELLRTWEGVQLNTEEWGPPKEFPGE